jgi:hypothetical protein
MGFKRTRNGEPRDRGTAGNEEVVEVETGRNEAIQDTGPNADGAGAEGGGEEHTHTLIARFFPQDTPQARRAASAEEMRTQALGKQAKLSTMGIGVTPVAGPGTANEKGARKYMNKGRKTGRRMRRDETTGG